MTELTVVERVEHALRTERDRLRMAGNIRASNAINSYLQEADTDSKQLLFKIVNAAPFDVEPATGGSPEEGPVIPIITEVRVHWEKILNVFIGVCETSACTYWMSKFWPNDDSDGIAASCREAGEPWYGSMDFWGKEGRAKIIHDDRDDGETQVTTVIGEAEIISGLNRMAQVCPVHFADLIAENDDATTHDVFMQCVLFGEIIFG